MVKEPNRPLGQRSAQSNDRESSQPPLNTPGWELDKWTLGLYGVPNLPLIQPGDDVASLVFGNTSRDGFIFRSGDIVVVAQKIVSKAEGMVVSLGEVEPSPRARELAEITGRDPRLCEVYLRESQEILGTKGRMVITRHRLGFVCTSAGVDRSNVAPDGEELVTLLPVDPDASARHIRNRLQELTGAEVAVIVSDSFGRPDRDGSIGVAIGIAGIRHLEEWDQRDLFDRPGRTGIDLVDELASAASIIMGETDERRPVVVIRGVRFTTDNNASIRELLVQ